jgi:NAD(P)-dependent dehydrogenase (short-subunit alcohol dehydrogenase family)
MIGRRKTGKSVVITGASSGLGRATALAFAREGARLGLIARSEDALLVLASEIRAMGGRALVFPADVTDPSAIEQAAETFAREHGGIDVWVNNAAVSIYGEADRVPLHEMRRLMDVNFFGQVIGARAALPYLERAPGGGVLIGVLSVLSEDCLPLQSTYVASKHALRGFYESFREELAHRGSRVRLSTLLAPSLATPLFDHARTYLGFLPRPLRPVLAPEAYAERLVDEARHPRRGPGGLRRRARAWLNYRRQLSRVPKAFSDGDNLFAPMPRSSAVRGSWWPLSEKRARGRRPGPPRPEREEARDREARRKTSPPSPRRDRG